MYERSKGTDPHGRSLDPPEYANYEKVFGRKLHWSMWGSQKKQFDEALEALTEKCGNCREGNLMVHAYSCPECGETMADHKVKQIPEQEEDLYRNTDVVCPHCDATARASKVYECIKQEGYGRRAKWVPGCDKPTLITPEGVDLTIIAKKAGTSQLIEILEFDEKEDLDVPSYMLEPWDFDYFFGQMSLEDQARAMNRENPFDEKAQGVVDNYFVTASDKEDEHSVPREIPF